MAMPITVLAPNLVKGVIVPLRSLGINEAYLEKFIQDDPSVLGLGDVVVRDRQRRQEKAGRLDLLLQNDSDEVRYEVELMLGSADESHLIRTIEYWDIERRRYPGYDHRAVLIAEDITTRFLNVIMLFSGSIPIIAIQVNAVTVGDKTGVTFLRVVDSTKLRRDDQIDIANLKSTDRAEWVSRVGNEIMNLLDECLRLINEGAKKSRSLNYKKGFVGLTEGAGPNNFVYFRPKKSFLWVNFNTLDPREPWVKRLEDAGLDVKEDPDGVFEVRLTTRDLAENRDLIGQLLFEAVKQDEKD
jgi:hypothetical protein